MGKPDSDKEVASSLEEEQKKSENADSSVDVGADELNVESLKETLSKETEKVEQYLANWQRTQADFINYKKRVEQEKEELAKYANTNVIIGLLQMLDDFERALKSMPPSLMGLTWVEGVFLMHRKLLTILEVQGLSEIKSLGEEFDPNLHEAVLYGEGDEGKVVEELQKGYKLHDRVIRPAMVKVGKRTEKGTEEPEEESSKENS